MIRRLFFCFCFLFALAAQGQVARKCEHTDQLFGKWKLDDVEGAEFPAKNIRAMKKQVKMVFNRDGTIILSDNKKQKNGTYFLSPDCKYLRILDEEGNEQMVFRIVSLEKKKMIATPVKQETSSEVKLIFVK